MINNSKNKEIGCRDCGSRYPENQMVAFNDDGTRSCEECSQICQICGLPHYEKSDFDFDSQTHISCQ